MKISLSTLKALFNKLTTREKVLLTGLIWIGALAWLSLVTGRFTELRAELNQANQKLESQQFWLDREDPIEERLAQALSKVNPENTFNSAQLVGKIDSFARKFNLNHELSSPRTQEGEVFNLHSLTLNARGKTLERLINFNKKIQEEFPYIALEELSLNASKSNPTLLDARFMINSFELNEQTAQ